MSTIDFTRPRSRPRPRVRRRRPPSLRVLYTYCWIATTLSQTGWVAVHIARGEWILLVLVPVYPYVLHLFAVLLEQAREWERIGRPLPLDFGDWLGLGSMMLLQVALWTLAT